MIRTDDFIDHDQITILKIWNTVDRIENHMGLMAHEIPELRDKLKAYQDGALKRSYFQEYLNHYCDGLNMGGAR